MRGWTNRSGFGLALVLLMAAPGMIAPATAAEIKIATKGAIYSPKMVTAKIGDILRFENDDAVVHGVFVPTRGFGANLGDLAPGKGATLPLPRAGAFEVECVYHDHMLLQVTVAP